MAIQDTLKEDRLRTLTLPAPLTVAPEMSVRDVIEAMRRHPHGEAAVVVRNDRPLGIFTERDVLLQVENGFIPADDPIEKHMSSRLATLSADDSIGEAIRVMDEHRYRHVPLIADDGTLAGMVRMRDILDWLAEAFPRIVLNVPPRPHQTMTQPEGG